MPYVLNGTVKLYYEVEGDGPPVILHTGAGGAGSMWREGGYVQGLAGFQRILFDHRGHGHSDTPKTLEDYRMEHYIADVVALLDALELARAAYWGYSDGAQVGYALAAAYPNRIIALVASGAIGDADRTTPAERVSASELAQHVQAEGMAAIVHDYESAGQPMTPWFRKQMLETNSEAFAREVLAWTEWNGPWAVLSQITCPALLLVGEREDPDGATARAAALMSHARCVTLPRLDHITAYEHSELALTHAMPFLLGLQWD